MEQDESAPARLIVTGTGTERSSPRLRAALRRALPEARVRRTDFYGVYEVEADGDPIELAGRAIEECAGEIGRIVAVFAEVTSKLDEIQDAAVAVAVARIGPHESFAFRVHKRGAHYLREDTPEIEREIGDAIGKALHEAHGKEPSVDLESPDVGVHAELLGPLTAVGLSLRRWSEAPTE